MGSILYNGPFDPVYHEAYLPPYQNFTVTVPSSYAAGHAQVNVAHATLIGVSNTWLPTSAFIVLIFIIRLARILIWRLSIGL